MKQERIWLVTSTEDNYPYGAFVTKELAEKSIKFSCHKLPATEALVKIVELWLYDSVQHV